MTLDKLVPSKEKQGMLYKIGFWFLTIFLVGFLCGTYFAQQLIILPKLMEAQKIGAVVINKEIYDLKRRP